MIRPARPGDAAPIAAIYDHYARTTPWTFAQSARDPAAYAQEIREGLYPFLVWEENGAVTGFACAEMFRPHTAYRWDVELTLYLRPEQTGRGLGSRLMKALLALLRAQGFINAYSCITSSNEASLRLHDRLGFLCLGEFPRTGYKHGQWHGVTWLQYPLQDYAGAPQDPTPFSALDPQTLTTILKEAMS